MTNLKKQFKELNQEAGVTLVELLAAVAILSIIVTSFLSYFVQAGRTNDMTTEVNEATFLAQEEMERVTALSNQQNTYEEVKAHYKNPGSEYVAQESSEVFTASRQSGSYNISIDITETDDLYKAVVEITEGKGSKNRAKMETRLPFAEEPEP